MGYTLESAMVETTLFKSNKSQAVRLPKDVAFPEDVRAVRIIRDGNRRIIAPADSSWDDFFAAPGIDLERGLQLPVQVREEL
jgi:antitoxin VapB